MTQEANIIQSSAVVQTISPNAQQRRRRRRKPRRDNNTLAHPTIDDPLTTTLQIQTARVSQSYHPQGSLYATPQTSRNPRIRNIPPPPPPLTPPPPSPPPPTQPPPPSARTFRNRRGNGTARLSSAASPIVPSLSFRQNNSHDSPPNNRRGGPPRRGNRRGGNRQGTYSGGPSRSESVYTGIPNSPPESSSPTTTRNPNRNYRARRGAQRGPPRSGRPVDHSSAPATASNIPDTSNVRQNSSTYSRGVVSATAPQRARPYGDQPSARMTNAAGSNNIALATQMLRTVAEQWSNNASLNEAPVSSRPAPLRTSTSVASASAYASRSVQYSPLRGGVTTTASVSYQGVSIGTSVAYAAGLGSARVTSAQTTVAAARPSWVQLLPTRHFTAQNAPRERQCPICLEDLVGARCRVLPCFHAFHIACVDQWFELSDTCPLDRKCVPHMLRQSGQILGSDTDSRDSWGSSGDYYEGHHPPGRGTSMMPPGRPIPADGEDLSAGLLQSVGRMVRNLLGL